MAYKGSFAAITCQVFVYSGSTTPSAFSMLVIPNLIAGIIAAIAKNI